MLGVGMTDRAGWVATHFDRCRPWIEDALARQPLKAHTIDHVREALDSGNCMLWPTANSAAVVEIVDHPTGLRTLHHWLAGGDLDELKQTAAAVEEFGRENGFGAVTISGRPGWTKALPGYAATATVAVKELR